MRPLPLVMAVMAWTSSALAQTERQANATSDSVSIAATTGSSAAATHTVSVGLQHNFDPDTIHAQPGDTIRFNFYPKNHSVVRADFKKPCIPWELTNDPAGSFFSGPIQQETLQSPIPSWDLEVTTTEPVFFYCSAPESCIRWSMVGVINPNATFTLGIQKQFVANSTFQLSPGEAFPDESSPSNSPAPDGGSSGPALSPGAIAGIAIGVVAVVAVVVAVVYLCGRRGGIKKGYRRSNMTAVSPPQIIEANYNDGGTKTAPVGSPYAASAHAEPYGSPSPALWGSQTGSPQNSYLGQPSQLSPGIPPYTVDSPLMPGQPPPQYFEAPDTQRLSQSHSVVPPVELPGSLGR
ncbi:hypothetical protein GGS23DRAFT_591070 [Durotheca rogersii]|uniref:uncharacterized protein n=1 Tax=Durotheca rogersii TaxID=419775 RepID=UPI00221E7369|nr:uncharacterized protein GGS23DRAFT_591070 [Durotheca rogersii]KAI5853660.1 hypothetical protein GGS23DRAFT_591070 [Durotheca rogersii]